MKVLKLLLLLFFYSNFSRNFSVSLKSSVPLLSRAFENITRHLWQIDRKQITVTNYQMSLSEVDAIVFKNIKREKIPLVLMNKKSEQLKSKVGSEIAF